MLDNFYLKGIIYDVEIYRNLLLIGFFSLRMKRYKTFIWYGCNDQRKEILNLIEEKILIGFNNWNFDDAIICKIAETIDNEDYTILDLWEYAQKLISREEYNTYKYSNKLFKSYDLLELIRAGYSVISLKSAAVNLKWNKIQDLPIKYDQEIKEEEIKLIREYNINDLDITNELVEYCKSSLEMRELLSNNYNLDLHSLSDSGLGKELFNTLYTTLLSQKEKNIDKYEIRKGRTFRKTIDFKDVIFPDIKFKTGTLKDYLEKLKEIQLSYFNEDETYSELERIMLEDEQEL